MRADMSNSNGDGKKAMCSNTPKPKKSSKYIENSVQEWLSCADCVELKNAKNTSCGLKLKLYRWSALAFISSLNCLEPGKLVWYLEDYGQKNVHGDSLKPNDDRLGLCETHRCWQGLLSLDQQHFQRSMMEGWDLTPCYGVAYHE